VRDNTACTASALSSIAHADAPPPELEVARIQRGASGFMLKDAPAGDSSAPFGV
jgi:hypothetical protein